MLSSLCVKIVRRLRNQKRITSNVEKDAPILPFFESDLEIFQKQKELSSLEGKSMTNIEKIENLAENKFNEKINSRKSKYFSLEDFKVKPECITLPTPEDQYERLASSLTPMHKISYEKQLKIKQRYVETVLRQLRRKMKDVDAPITSLQKKLPCPLEFIIPSPDIMSYRNKDEFSVHVGVDGNKKTVGYFFGSPINPNMRCINPYYLINIKDSHKTVVKHFESFIRISQYEACLKFSEGGIWRNLIVRSTNDGQIMAVVIIYPDPKLKPEDKEKLKEDLGDYFFNGPGVECGLSSLYLQACMHSKCSRESAPYELIKGEEFLYEDCLGKKFRISPDAFFQINTKGAELMYNKISQIAEMSYLTTLVDVCCGTGPVSILLADKCRGTMGIDSVSGSIEDAKYNTRINQIKNSNFICSQVEHILPDLTRELNVCGDVVAVVNPARGGLHPSVMHTIRNCPSINKVVFVTCKPEGVAMSNMTTLTSTILPKPKVLRKIGENFNKEKTDPFTLRYAVPIDLFPHTLHIEYILLFERVPGFI